MVEWKKIPGRDNYSISTEGEVKNDRTGKILKQGPSTSGYARVSLSNGTGKTPKILFPHRAVAEAFIPNPDNKPEVNHLNSNRMDPRKSNLEWVTPKENTEHSIQRGRWNPLETSRKANKVSVEKISKPVIVTNSGKVEREFPSISAASRELGLSHKGIRQALDKDKTIQGYEIKKKK